MYVYGCNAIMTTAMKNRRYKDIFFICFLTELTPYFKRRGINPGLHFMDNKESTALKIAMTTMDINYKLPPSQGIRGKKSRERDPDVQ